ncbi:MAG: serine protease [Candidatus Mesenet longicola]|uniref:Probable periplasmic serine endoprotease DegP-like n=1 Tax=Candidatus Mesenet longicola TaxID=1892558 RepID=A0A8J3MQ87_9RICK|nr:MAG: serine protease [Candidatus Mesenet longicola]GHM59292.1 MAG: serine protease [Candidatus Mesenet longicola]
MRRKILLLLIVNITMFTNIAYAKQHASVDENIQLVEEQKFQSNDIYYESFADLVEQLAPAVVNVSTEQIVRDENIRFPQLPGGSLFEEFREFFERIEPFMNRNQDANKEVISLGSGFIIDESGIIVTNYHVIADAKEITVTLNDNTQSKATILGKDPKTDLAVLKIDTDKKLSFVRFGNSDKARVGDRVIAIGNPFGLGGSVSTGIVSAIARNINIGTVSDFIQTDAAINKGNSGGPLFNMNGEIIGINTAIFSPSGGNVGIGFAIPSVIAEQVIELLKEGKKVEHGWIGVKVQAVTKEIADSLGLEATHGALVAEITKGSPADKAGIKVGDIIVEFNETKVTKMSQLPQVVSRTEIGKKVNIKLYRKGEVVGTTVKVGRIQDDEDLTQDEDDLYFDYIGVTVSSLPNEFKKENDGVNGIVVLNVDVKSNAHAKGIRRGDIITHINQNEIKNIDEFKKIISQVKKEDKESVALLIKRQNNNLYVTIKLK